MKALREMFKPNHGYLLLPPILYDATFNVEKDMRTTSTTLDAAAAAVDSWFITVTSPHEMQHQIFRVFERPKGKSVRQCLQEEWPNAVDTMADVVRCGNDCTLDLRGATRMPDIDVEADGWLDEKSNSVTLIRWPAVDACGERKLTDICGGDAEIAQLYMCLCVLHCEMRVSEALCEELEEKLRGKLISGGGGDAAVKAFNAALWQLRLRHKIQRLAAARRC